MLNPAKQPNQQTRFEKKILSTFEQSLTEEQRFLQNILNGKIKMYSHEDVMADLRAVLKR